MKIKYLKDIKNFKPSVLAIGVFDGVHKGHLKVLEETKSIAQAHGLSASVLTFNPHPLSILKPQTAPPLIIDFEERLSLLKKIGIEQIAVAKFTKQFAKESAEKFMRETALKKLKAKWIVVGENYHFGKTGEGDKKLLIQLSEKFKFNVKLIPSLKLAGHKVSSSLIRKLISQGKIFQANKYLNRYYSFKGKVKKGSGRGETLGFPTANLLPVKKFLLKDGVYAGLVFIDNKKKKAMIDVGRRPTFGESSKVIEVHILEYNKNIYSKTLEVFFVKRLRSEKKFSKEESLIKQLKKDEKTTQKLFEK